MRASEIIQLLKQKHHEDIFIPECKNGPTWNTNGMIKFDAWAMKKSWTNPLVVGYEIKINRQDFLNDSKWMNYLNYCNEFYFVSPTELISIHEVPADAGLYWVSRTGTILYRKKKAPYRNIEIPEEIYRYILMSRTTVTTENHRIGTTKKWWENWLKERKIDHNFGYHVSKKIKEMVEEEVLKTRRENERLKSEVDKLGELKVFIESLGYRINQIHNWNFKEMLSNRLKELEQGIPQGLVNYIDQTITNLTRARDILNKDAEETHGTVNEKNN